MKKSNTKPLSLYLFLSFVFVIASIGIAVIKLTSISPEYTMVIATLLLGAVGALQCLHIQKRRDKPEDVGSLHQWASMS